MARQRGFPGGKAPDAPTKFVRPARAGLFADSAQEIIGAGQIASAEAFGQPAVAAEVDPAGIVTAQAFGQPSLAPAISATGIPSAEAPGQPAVAAEIDATGIATAEAFGLPTAAAEVDAAGVVSTEAFGAPGVAAELDTAGIQSAEAFGLPFVYDPNAPWAITDAGAIVTAEAFGAPQVGDQVAQQGGGGGYGFSRGRQKKPAVARIRPLRIVAAEIEDAGAIESEEAVGAPTITAGARGRAAREAEMLLLAA